MSMYLEMAVTPADNVTVVSASGSIDGKTAPVFQERILQAINSADRVLIDLSHASYMSSAGVRAMLFARQQLQLTTGKNFALAQIPENIQDVIKATGFLPFFKVFDTVEAGLQEFRR